MKSTLKTLAAAVGLALASSGAQAALVTGALSSADSELFVIAFDPTSQHTFVKDLGIKYTELNSHSGAGDYNWFTSVDLGSLVSPGSDPGQFTFGAGVKWNLAAGRAQSSGFTAANNGVFGTYNVTKSTPADAWKLQKAAGDASLTAAKATLSDLRVAVTSKATSLNTSAGTAGTNHFASTSAADNSSYVFDSTTGGRSFAGSWGDKANNKAPFTLSGTVGTDDYLAFYHWYLTSDGGEVVHSDLQPGVWRLSAEGVLSYGAGPAAPVPVPAAAWLLGSALIGLGARRRKSN